MIDIITLHGTLFYCSAFLYIHLFITTNIFLTFTISCFKVAIFDAIEFFVNVEVPPHGLEHSSCVFLPLIDNQPPRALWHEDKSQELNEGRDARQAEHVPERKGRQVINAR